MPKVKSEERDATFNYTPSGHTQQRQHVAQQLPRSTAPSDPVLAIAQASHEALLASGNVVYRAAIQELDDLRAAIKRYQLQNMELSIHHEAARDAYMRLYGQMKANACHLSHSSSLAPSSGQPQNLNTSRNTAPHNPALHQASQAPLSSLPPQVSASSQGSQDHLMYPRTSGPPSAPATQVSLSSQVSAPGHASNLSRVSAISSLDPIPAHASHVFQVHIPPQAPAYPPVPAQNSAAPPSRDATNQRGDDRLRNDQPGGSSIVNSCGPHSVSPAELHSAHPSNELFWNRSDWLSKGCPNNSFITDENGKSLTFLIRNIRFLSRKIWTDMAERRGSNIASSFNRNSQEFKREFVERIEAIHPCLKLCNDHWKALQIGMSSYNYWYKRVWKGGRKHF